MDVLRVPVWLSLLLRMMLQPPSVSLPSITMFVFTNVFQAKFSGYQYGGRPLGLTYVKYLSAGGDAMEGTEGTGGLTQDQIM